VQLTEKPKVLVIDFFRGSAGTSSRLGTLLADRFSESLSNFSRELTVLDRQLLKDYLRKEWTTLGDFHSNEASLQLGVCMARIRTIPISPELRNFKASLFSPWLLPPRGRQIQSTFCEECRLA
jgi:hypothetical protein